MRLERLVSILVILANTKRITIGELATRLEVSRRTVIRDLEILNGAGVPIVSYPGMGGGVSVMEGYQMNQHILSAGDTNILFTALSGFKSILGETSNLLAKLIPDSPEVSLQKSIYQIDFSSWFGDSLTQQKASDLKEAIENHQCIELEYISKEAHTIRIVEPHKMVFKQSYWYLYAFCRKREDFRLFRLNRMVSCTKLDAYFEPTQ